MQATEADNKSHKIHGDEECINFRPSPNFKHMRKYLKSKLEEANSTPNQGAEIYSTLNVDEQEKVKKMAALVQPPLPPNPPPPDSPPNITLKKEIEDDDYQSNNAEDACEINHSEQLIADYVTDEVDNNMDKPEKIMCRRFVRGTCTRGSSCIFVHEIILSQLPSVYTFCKNFQNTVCTFPKCKFVHATVFEKESFYRSGYLPPHTLAHLKDTNVLQPPPPPPLPKGTRIKIPAVFPNPPPPFIHTGVPPLPVLSCMPNTNLENRNNHEVFGGAIPTSTSPLKRERSDIEDFSSSPRALDSGEPLVKKCKDCDVNEFRLQCSKNKVEKMMASSEEMNKKISQITKKNNKLYTVFISLFKSMNNKAPNSAHGLNTSLNMRSDKETDVMEQLNSFLTSSNRMSLIGDDNAKNLLGGNLSFLTVLAKLLLSTGERISPNAS